MAKKEVKKFEDIKFGMEIESYVYDPERYISIGEYHRGRITDCGWLAERDGSLGESPKNYFVPVEMVSPVLSIHSADEAIASVSNFLQDRKAYMNNRCGIHIHIGMPNGQVLSFVRNLVSYTALIEPVLYTTGGITGRILSKYCYPLLIPKRSILNFYASPFTLLNYLRPDTHYGGLNTYHMRHNNIEKDTIEFRYFSNPKSNLFTMEYAFLCFEITMNLVKSAIEDSKEEALETINHFDIFKADEIIGTVCGLIEKPIAKTSKPIIEKLSKDLVKNWDNVLNTDKDLVTLYSLR